MSKLLCKCGYVMVARTMEEEFLYDLVPQKELLNIVSEWKILRTDIHPDSFTNMYNQSRKDLYICPSCGRVLIQSESDPNLFDSYVKEAGKQ